MSFTIAVTGLGAVSSLGTGVRAIVDAMREGRDGLSEMERDDIRALHPIRFAGWIRDRWERGEHASLAVWSRDAAREAWNDARVPDSIARERIAVVSGTTIGEDGSITGIASVVAEAIGARGPCLSISTACASSANAIGLGRDLLLSGDADVVIAGGAEMLIPATFAGFAALGVLAADKCAPFGDTLGTTLGEGAGFVVLERAEGVHPRARSYLLGYGLSSDAWHETSPDPRGAGIARSMTSSLCDAGVEASEVDYVNAHGTGTAANDDSEWRGIQAALGARARAIPVSGSKGFLGHAQGAAGALETIATMACMREGRVPPSVRVGSGRRGGPSDLVVGVARPGAIHIALSNSAAFGGANATLAVSSAPRTRPRIDRVVRIVGTAILITERGATRDDETIARECGDADLRTTDPATRFALAAAGRALAEAGVRVRGPLRDRTGIFGGANHPPASSIDEFKESLTRGDDRASAPAFARSVGHAPIAAASRVLGMRGPLTMVAAEGVAGLAAIAYAARWLRHRDDADRIVAGAVEERAMKSKDEEGAALALVSCDGEGPRVAGVAIAGELEDAIARALRDASLREDEIDVWMRAPESTSLRSAWACVEAARSIREGARAAIAAASGPHGAVALVLMGDRG